MSKITLNDVTNINSLSVINANFDKIEQEFQNKVLYRANPSGEPNTVEQDIDMNGYDLLNVGDVFSTNGRWATIDEVEEIRDEVASAAITVADNKDIAVASATAAASSYDNFDDRYLGQKTSDPSVDNDGGLLLTGALYFRTSGTPIMRVYNGTTWQDVGSITTTTTNLIDPSLYSSQAEAEAGANNTKVMTPLRVKNAIDTQVKAGFTSTGAIVLPGDAVSDLQAVPKQQVDDLIDVAVANRLRIQTFTAQATTSGTYVDFTGVPSWAKQIVIMMSYVSGSTAGSVKVRALVGGSEVTTGYLGTYFYFGSGSSAGAVTDAFCLYDLTNSATNLHGATVLNLMGSNTWTCNGSVARHGGVAEIQQHQGSTVLAGSITGIRVLLTSGTFDGGSVNIVVMG